jgi:hypothetical protein
MGGRPSEVRVALRWTIVEQVNVCGNGKGLQTEGDESAEKERKTREK